HGLSELAHDHVRWLDVPVDDALTVREGDGLDHGDHVGEQRHALAQRGPRADDLLERLARNQLHDIERLARRPAPGIVYGHDAGVLETRGDQRLAEEERLGKAHSPDELLDRYHAAQPLVV